MFGARLHGDELGSVDRNHNLPGSRLLDADEKRATAARQLMPQPPYLLDSRRRKLVLSALQEVCVNRDWVLLAAHVRTNHVHAVVQAETHPEKIMNDFKAYASRRLNRSSLDEAERRRWARHGSTRYLSRQQQVSAAIRYVVDDQGEPMEVFEASAP